jgi:hypothetical protein
VIFLKTPGTKGQAVLEFCLTALALAPLVAAAVLLLYFAWAKLWIRHVLYESLICRLENVPPRICEREAHDALARGLPAGRLELLRITRRGLDDRGRIRLRLPRGLYVDEGTTLHHTLGRTVRPDGFVEFLFLIPLALTVMVSFALAASVLGERARQLQTCRSALLAASEEIEKGAENILALNPSIEFLHAERERLELEKIEAMGHPALLAAVEALIRKNELQQLAKAARQRALQARALAQARGALAPLRGQHSIPRLRLQAHPTWQTAKTRARPPAFSALHRLAASWVTGLNRYQNVFLFPTGFETHWNIQCAATIREEGGRWIAALAR